MLVLLAVDGDGTVPRPVKLKELTVLGLGRVELGELVALIVGSDVEDGLVVITTDDESTLDDGVVGLAEDGSATEEVLAGSLETVVEASNEVARHEGHGELIVVLVVNLPDGVLVERNVLPEPLEGVGGLLVGVLALPLVEREGGAGKKLKGVLGLGGLGGLVLLLSGRGGSLGSGLLLGLGSLSLLGGDVGQLGGVEKGELGGNSRVDGLVVDGLVPTGGVGELLAPLLVEEELEAAGNDANGEEIGEGDAVTER